MVHLNLCATILSLYNAVLTESLWLLLCLSVHLEELLNKENYQLIADLLPDLILVDYILVLLANKRKL